MKDAIDQILKHLIPFPKNIGLAVGVINREHSNFFGYGKVKEFGLVSPQGNTLFEIGSVTKCFTTGLLSLLISESKVNLNDQVRDLMPELSNFSPDITLERLATHTSGLPKMPLDIFWTMLRHRKNPFAYYPAKKVYQYLSRYHSKQTIDRKIKYSNLGMALLGHILANNLDLSYEQAIINNLCDRLNIQDTRITLNSEQKQRLAIPHSAKGRVSLNWDLNAFAGAGALRSTVNDLMVFLKAHLGILHIDLSEKLKLCHEKYLGTFSKPSKVLSLSPDLVKKRKKFKPYFQAIGLGWIIGNLGLEGPTLHWVHGATGGYMAFIGFIKSSNIGIVILANRGLSFSEEISEISIADEIGFRLLEYLNSI